MTQAASQRSWRKAFVQGVSAAHEIAHRRGVSEAELADIDESHRRFPFRATDYYLALADPEDRNDPILAQVFADPRELEEGVEGYCADAVGDLDPQHHKAPGLVHKYPGRALLVTTSACPVHCRFCFRRNYPYEELADAGPGMRHALDVIREDPTITEVILSGGDPLSMSEDSLAALLDELTAIGHLRRLRIHSRYPVVLPERVGDELVRVLSSCGLPVWLVTHFNHPRELTEEALASCRRLQRAGVPVLNQSVLLAGVNDSDLVLQELFEGLLDAGIKPYYLHQLDQVNGVSHFEVAQERGAQVYESLRSRLSGIGLPSFVRDLPGSMSKTPFLSLLVMLVAVTLMGGCRGSDPTEAVTPANPVAPVSEASTRQSGQDGPDSIVPVASRPAVSGPQGDSVRQLAVDAPPLARIDRLLSADLGGDGAVELFVSMGGEVRWGEWPAGAEAPDLRWSFKGRGMLQAWLAHDLDQDGRDEVVLAFGRGRGFPNAALEVVLIDQPGKTPVSSMLTKSNGPRNQATSLQAWPRKDGSFDIYLAAFETRFMVRGGVLPREGGGVSWMPGHTIRMGMARAVGDFDDDGRPEVAVGRLYGDKKGDHGDLRLLQEDGSSEPISTLRGVRALGSFDLEGDGQTELLFGDGWHINYGKLARYRPSVARRSAAGWSVEVLEESAQQYAVEKIGGVGGFVLAGGNAEVRVYRSSGKGWKAVSGPWPSSMSGAWTVLPGRGVVVGGASLAGPYPLP